MNSEALFNLALGLQSPWEVREVKFAETDGRNALYLQIGFIRGAKFPDQTGALCGVHDTVSRQWQHLNFFEHACYLQCDVPRIKDSAGKVKTVPVPWARPESGFTLMFEAMVMALIEREMPINRVAELLRVHPHRVWKVFKHWVGEARANDTCSEITQLGIDETSTRKGHHYVTLGVDMVARRVIHVTEGRDKEAVKSIKQHLASKNVSAEQIKQVSIDMSPAFIAGVEEHFTEAKLTFDRFHVVKLLNEAMDRVRKTERKEHDLLKGHKYTFLKNKDKLSEKKRVELDELITLYPKLGAAYRLKTLFHDLWEMPTKEDAQAFLIQWCAEVRFAKLHAFEPFIKTLIAHWYGILHYIESKLTNGLLEGINNKVQLAKRRARGYRNTSNFIDMIYFLCGKLDFNYPLYST